MFCNSQFPNSHNLRFSFFNFPVMCQSACFCKGFPPFALWAPPTWSASVGFGAECIGSNSVFALFNFPIPASCVSVFFNYPPRRKSVCLVSVFRLSRLSSQRLLGFCAKCIGFHRGFRAFQNPIAHLCALELSTPPHRRKSACF